MNTRFHALAQLTPQSIALALLLIVLMPLALLWDAAAHGADLRRRWISTRRL